MTPTTTTMPTTRLSGTKTRSKTKGKSTAPQPAAGGTHKRATSQGDDDRLVKKQHKAAEKDEKAGDKEGKSQKVKGKWGPAR
jgi:hypothetical protein